MHIFFLFAVGMYFLPAIIGWNKRSSGGILLLNLFLGWTVIGWIIALIWAITSDPAATHVVVYPTAPAQPAYGKYCAACGGSLVPGGHFCSRCGARLAT